MDLNLSNGDKIAIWDQISATAQNSWATILHPDGSYQVAEVQPLADGASPPWTTSGTHTTYPTRWHVEIPATHSRFQVKVTGPDNQQPPQGPVEATGAVTGSDAGTPVTGHTYIEEAG